VTDVPEITIRYFDARGRAQFLRYYLEYRGIPFDDDRVPLSPDFSAWVKIRDDRSVTGPFHKLPVLHWGDRLIAESAVIRSFLHEALGDAARLSDEDNARDAMLASSISSELMLPIGMLIWADLFYEGIDLPAFANKTLTNVHRHLAVLEQTVNQWSWFEAARPLMLVDCLLWEELDVAQRTFGDHLSFAESPTLARFYDECPGRETFDNVLRDKPCQITGRPGEPEAISKIHKLLSL